MCECLRACENSWGVHSQLNVFPSHFAIRFFSLHPAGVGLAKIVRVCILSIQDFGDILYMCEKAFFSRMGCDALYANVLNMGL